MNVSSRKALCSAAARPIRWVVKGGVEEGVGRVGAVLERRGEVEAVGRRDGSGGRGVAVGWRAVVGGRWAAAVARVGGGEGEGSREEEEEVEWVEEEEREEEREEEGHEEGDGTRRSAWKSCVVVACVCKRGVCAVLAYCCTRACVYVAYDTRTYTTSRVRGAPCRGDSHEKQRAQPRVAACYSKLVNHPAE